MRPIYPNIEIKWSASMARLPGDKNLSTREQRLKAEKEAEKLEKEALKKRLEAERLRNRELAERLETK